MKTHNFTIAGLDTDSIAFCKPDNSPFSEVEQQELLAELNSNFPEKIKWAHDGLFERFCVLKSKNYITHNKWSFKKGVYALDPKSAYKKKGSSLKSSKLEPRVKDFMSEIIKALIDNQTDQLLSIYQSFIKEIHVLQDIKPWAKKATITEAVLNPGRSNEENVLQAIEGLVGTQMGDKVYLYYSDELVEDSDSMFKLKLIENWSNDHNPKLLCKRLYNTLEIFKNVIDITQFPKYHLKGKKVREELRQLLEM